MNYAWPSLATITEVSKSGTEVPAAKNVSPIKAEFTLNVSPMRVAIHTMINENIDIQIIETKNDKM